MRLPMLNKKSRPLTLPPHGNSLISLRDVISDNLDTDPGVAECAPTDVMLNNLLDDYLKKIRAYQDLPMLP
jgi:hypothetical protein